MMIHTPVRKSSNDEKFKMPTCPPPPRQYTRTSSGFSADRDDTLVSYPPAACLNTDILIGEISPGEIPLYPRIHESHSADVGVQSDSGIKVIPSSVSPSPYQRRLLFAEDTEDELEEDFISEKRLTGFFLSPPCPAGEDILSHNNSFVVKKLKPRPSNLHRPYPTTPSSTVCGGSRSILYPAGMKVPSLSPRVPSYRPSLSSRTSLGGRKASVIRDLTLSSEPSSFEKQTNLEQRNSFNPMMEERAKHQCTSIHHTCCHSFPRAA